MASAPEARRASSKEAESAIHADDDAVVTNGHSNSEKPMAAAAEATKMIADVTQDAIHQGREIVGNGLGVVAGASLPMVEITYDRGRRLLDTAARVTELYREAANSTAGDMQALVQSYSQFGQGLLRMQHEYLSSVQSSFSRAKHQPQDLLRCKSVADFAEVQKDLYVDGVAFMMESSSALVRLAGEVVRNAAGPLEARAPKHARD
jgi:hypothetical protein